MLPSIQSVSLLPAMIEEITTLSQQYEVPATCALGYAQRFLGFYHQIVPHMPLAAIPMLLPPATRRWEQETHLTGQFELTAALVGAVLRHLLMNEEWDEIGLRVEH